jgi:hypothetical protein
MIDSAGKLAIKLGGNRDYTGMIFRIFRIAGRFQSVTTLAKGSHYGLELPQAPPLMHRLTERFTGNGLKI